MKPNVYSHFYNLVPEMYTLVTPVTSSKEPSLVA